MEELIAFVARSLVDDPESVKTERRDEDETVTIELSVAADDLGKVIGKQGRTARALRSILGAAAAKDGLRSRLDIVE